MKQAKNGQELEAKYLMESQNKELKRYKGFCVALYTTVKSSSRFILVIIDFQRGPKINKAHVQFV